MMKAKLTFYGALRRFCAIIAGSVFFVAGTLKLIDPVGAGLVVEEYLKFLHMDWLSPAAQVIAVILALLENVVGSALIAGVARRKAAIAALAMQLFFTLLTLILVIFDPPMDCGCFGEAIHLTNTETFIKNLILVSLMAAAFFPLGKIGKATKPAAVAFVMTCVATIALMIYSLQALPLMDFTEFKPGTDLSEAKDGASLLAVTDNMDEDTSVLESGLVLAISVNDPASLGEEDWDRIHCTVSAADSCGLKPVLLLSSDPGAFFDILEQSGLDADAEELLYMSASYADHRKLLTFNRSNGGAVVLADGMIVEKFTESSLPAVEELETIASSDPVEMRIEAGRQSLWLQGYFLYSFSLLVLL